MTREQKILSWLLGPDVRFYTDAERLEEARYRPQSREEAREAERLYPMPTYLTGSVEHYEEARQIREARRAYRKIEPRSPEQLQALIEKLAQRGARSTWCRTDPCAGLYDDPAFTITAAECKRYRLGAP